LSLTFASWFSESQFLPELVLGLALATRMYSVDRNHRFESLQPWFESFQPCLNKEAEFCNYSAGVVLKKIMAYSSPLCREKTVQSSGLAS